MWKITSMSAILLLIASSVFSINTAAQTLDGKQNELINRLVGDSVEGVWNLNIYESDDPVRKMVSLIQKSLSKTNETVQNEVPGMSISIFPPERLVLAGGENEMTINEFYSNVISTRTINPDGQSRLYQAENNAQAIVKAGGQRKLLLIETLSPRGNRMKETFELSGSGGKLKVLIQISDPNSKELLTLQRVYDRAGLDDSLDYN